MKRVLALLVFALTVASLALADPVLADESSSVIAPATPVEGEVEGVPGALTGADALVALVLDNELGEVAARADWTAGELTSTLLTDATAYVTENGRVGYADPAPEPLTGTPVETPPAAHVDRSSVFTLHSQPAATMSIYLDFDGQVTTTKPFNTRGDSDPGNDIATIMSTPFDRDGNPGSLCRGGGRRDRSGVADRRRGLRTVQRRRHHRGPGRLRRSGTPAPVTPSTECGS